MPADQEPGRNARRTASGDGRPGDAPAARRAAAPPAADTPGDTPRPAGRRGATPPATSTDAAADTATGPAAGPAAAAASAAPAAARDGSGGEERGRREEPASGEQARTEGRTARTESRTADGGTARTDREAETEAGSAAAAAALPAAAGGTGTASTASAPEPPADGPDGEGASGRPRKPMLAAAAVAGAVLLVVPLLLLDDGSEEKRTATVHAAQDTLLTDAQEEQGAFVPDEPDPAAAPTPSVTRPGKKGKSAGAHGQDAATGVDDRPPGNPPAGGTDDTPADDAPAGDTPPRDAPDGRQGSTPDGRRDSAPSSTPQRQKSATGAEAEPRMDTAAKPAASGNSVSWGSTRHRVANANSGDCLARHSPGRFVGTGACGANTWQQQKWPEGYVLLRISSTNWCLDTDGYEMYVSPCTQKDPGQRWRMRGAEGCSVYLTGTGGTYLTGWNDRTANMLPLGASRVDKPAKQRWKISPAPSGLGC
ncbi:hypothetical protein [Streptomyces sp. DH37]|uniref:hypothetical protein n=1 Tax=Streptomyces sp. DH37 TaxID=3040122 RepID=UPI0024435101|nr:hypothetical protein [Streptomyces sp. DH37]MDG9706456.1 hypothetical protein [Streptomyces sp. DH37]